MNASQCSLGGFLTCFSYWFFIIIIYLLYFLLHFPRISSNWRRWQPPRKIFFFFSFKFTPPPSPQKKKNEVLLKDEGSIYIVINSWLFLSPPEKYFVKWSACDYDLCFVYEDIRVDICVVMKTKKKKKTRDKTVLLNSKSRLCSFSLSLSPKIDEWISCSPDSNFFQTTKTDPFFPGPP